MRLGRLSSCRSRGALREEHAPRARGVRSLDPGFAPSRTRRCASAARPLGVPRRSLACARRHSRSGLDELGRLPRGGTALRRAASVRCVPGVWGTARWRPRSSRPMSAAHDSIFKDERPLVTVHSAPIPHGAGALGSRRWTRFGEPAEPDRRRSLPRDRSAVRTSDASSLRGLPGGTLPRPPARPAGRAKRPRVVPESLGLLRRAP